MTVHGTDDRLLDGVGELRPGFDEIVAVGVSELFGRHLFDIGSGCEGFVGTSQDDRADGGVAVEFFERGIEFLDQRSEECVQGFWSRELN